MTVLSIRNVLLISALFFATQTMASTQNDEIRFNALCDFNTLNINVIRDKSINVELDITLQPEARARLARVTRQNINNNLVMFINGLKLNTVTIREEINSESLRVSIEKKKAKSLFSTLLNQDEC